VNDTGAVVVARLLEENFWKDKMKTNGNNILPIAILFLLCAFKTTDAVGLWGEDSSQSCSWNYDDPNKWGDICSDYTTCKTGTFQSPINIKMVYFVRDFKHF
jgi:carbonic anhydrase